MPKLDQVREFRHAAAPATDEARRRAHECLARAIDAEERLETDTGREPHVGRRIVKRRAPVLALGALVAAGAAALLLSAPWKNSPGFLARAEAALTTPPGMILHEQWTVTNVSNDPACTATRGPSEIWIDQPPPRRFRVLLNEPPPPTDRRGDLRREICGRGTVRELGGYQNWSQTLLPQTLMFVPPSKLRVFPGTFVLHTDPVTNLHEAIRRGMARDEGKTQLKGGTVERIRLNAFCPISFSVCSPEPAYAYVDPQTFHPIEIHAREVVADPNRGGVFWSQVLRIQTLEYLPRTAANLALTNIRAQHPHATGP